MRERDNKAVLLQAEMVLRGAERNLFETHDLESVRERYMRMCEVVQPS